MRHCLTNGPRDQEESEDRKTGSVDAAATVVGVADPYNTKMVDMRADINLCRQADYLSHREDKNK